MTNEMEGRKASRVMGSLALVGAILVVAFVMGVVVRLALHGTLAFAGDAQGASGNVAVVDGDGVRHSFPLSEDGVYEITSSFGTNVVEVKHGEVHMKSADCPNQDCVEQGVIDGPGAAIICMPHHLVVSVESQDSDASRADSAFE